MGLAQRTVMMFDFPAVQLENELSIIIDQPFVVGSAVVTPNAEQPLKPQACGLDIVDGEEWLWTHDQTVPTAAHCEAVLRERNA